MKTAVRKYPCAICGKEDRADRMHYSRHTGARYCNDDAACARRAKKTKR